MPLLDLRYHTMEYLSTHERGHIGYMHWLITDYLDSLMNSSLQAACTTIINCLTTVELTGENLTNGTGNQWAGIDRGGGKLRLPGGRWRAAYLHMYVCSDRILTNNKRTLSLSLPARVLEAWKR